MQGLILLVLLTDIIRRWRHGACSRIVTGASKRFRENVLQKKTGFNQDLNNFVVTNHPRPNVLGDLYLSQEKLKGLYRGGKEIRNINKQLKKGGVAISILG